VEAFVPSAQKTKLSPESAAASQKVREALNDLSRSENRRRRMIEDLRYRMEADDIRTLRPYRSNVDDVILEEPTKKDITDPADFEELFASRIETHYAENREVYRQDQTDSAKLRTRLREANAVFIKSRRTDTSLEERERALQKLEIGYAKFLEIAQNLDEGRKFYNELARMLGRWREEIRGFVYQRKKEARDLEGSVFFDRASDDRDLSGDMARLRLSDGGGKSAPLDNRRTSQRVTRSTRPQTNEESTEGKKSKEGKGGVSVWTPGMSHDAMINKQIKEFVLARPRN
jgi:hypothetical protein